MKRKAKIDYQVVGLVLEEIKIIEKINRQWKEGVITEFQFSTTLDRLLANIKEHQAELKKSGSRSLEEESMGGKE